MADRVDLKKLELGFKRALEYDYPDREFTVVITPRLQPEDEEKEEASN